MMARGRKWCGTIIKTGLLCQIWSWSKPLGYEEGATEEEEDIRAARIGEEESIYNSLYAAAHDDWVFG
jgi:hypothetical protein